MNNMKLYYTLVFQTQELEPLRALLQALLKLHEGRLVGVDVRESTFRKDELHLSFKHVEEAHEPVLRAIGVSVFANGVVRGVSLDSGYSNYD